MEKIFIFTRFGFKKKTKPLNCAISTKDPEKNEL